KLDGEVRASQYVRTLERGQGVGIQRPLRRELASVLAEVGRRERHLEGLRSRRRPQETKGAGRPGRPPDPGRREKPTALSQRRRSDRVGEQRGKRTFESSPLERGVHVDVFGRSAHGAGCFTPEGGERGRAALQRAPAPPGFSIRSSDELGDAAPNSG